MFAIIKCCLMICTFLFVHLYNETSYAYCYIYLQGKDGNFKKQPETRFLIFVCKIGPIVSKNDMYVQWRIPKYQ